MTEKNIFAYISDFNLFLCENCNSPWKKSPPLSQQPPSKSWGPVKPPFLKTWLETQPPLQKGGAAHYVIPKQAFAIEELY